ncbi:hypothetical protein D3C86_1218970 [compost metagenome]
MQLLQVYVPDIGFKVGLRTILCKLHFAIKVKFRIRITELCHTLEVSRCYLTHYFHTSVYIIFKPKTAELPFGINTHFIQIEMLALEGKGTIGFMNTGLRQESTQVKTGQIQRSGIYRFRAHDLLNAHIGLHFAQVGKRIGIEPEIMNSPFEIERHPDLAQCHKVQFFGIFKKGEIVIQISPGSLQ